MQPKTRLHSFLLGDMGKRFQRIHDLVGLVHALYAPELAEAWDNVGLQVGDPGAALERVMVSLDPCLAAVHAAHSAGAQALVTHHPLLFSPLKKLTPDDPVGEIVWTAVQSGVAIISAHTNLDSAADGLNSWLADCLGLTQTLPLQPAAGNYLKLVVFVPTGYEEAVAEALFAAGAGEIGNYAGCSFRSCGEGTFRPGEGSKPFIGKVGQSETVAEIRLEMIVPRGRLARVLEKMLKAHPYEEVAYDLIPLQKESPGVGMGRIGRLEQELTLDDFVAQIKASLGCQSVRVSGLSTRPIRKVAVCGGAGAGLLRTAHRQGADVLVTGDVKYHEARQAEDLGIVLVDAGHFATERLMIGQMSEVLRQSALGRGWDIVVEEYSGEHDPFRIY